MSGRLTPHQMIEALRLGASERALGLQAAVHLVASTALPHTGRFHDAHVEIEETGGGARAAWVISWKDLLSDQSLRLSGGEARVVAVAASYARGIPVNLAENGGGLGHGHARALLEAVAIGAGVDGLYEIRVFHAQMSGETR